jgi:hypothetical protein
VLLPNDANILVTQHYIPDSLELDNVAVHDNIWRIKILLPICKHTMQMKPEMPSKRYALIMESLPHTKSNPWKK